MWFDGGSRGNPGVSGAGAVMFDDKEKELYRWVGGWVRVLPSGRCSLVG